ncbi:protein of unknown function DB domain-containing protein [Aphelenchoides besseyi]|nr:protein of unknown function DB domain-containing protein [Aphelenchoides besseyi]
MSDAKRTLQLTLLLGFISASSAQYFYSQGRYYYIPQQPYQNPYYSHQQQFYAPRAPVAIQPPLQQQQQFRQTYVPEKKPIVQKNRSATNTFEFDIPPPPSRFLSEDDRAKIISSSKSGRPEHVGVASVQSQRSRLITGSTDQTRPLSHQSVAQPAPSVQVHHLQVPRLIPKPNVQTPSQITHLIANSSPATLVVTTRSVPTTIETIHVTEAIIETTTTLGSPTTSHLSPSHGKKVDPNKVFLQCCQDKKVAKTCESKCSFSGINKKSLTAMFLGTDPCPQKFGLDLFACAAQENDHTPCCKSKNVQRTSAGNKCLAFCNLRPETRFQADASYLPCWGVLHDVKDCFKEAIIRGNPIL